MGGWEGMADSFLFSGVPSGSFVEEAAQRARMETATQVLTVGRKTVRDRRGHGFVGTWGQSAPQP